MEPLLRRTKSVDRLTSIEIKSGEYYRPSTKSQYFGQNSDFLQNCPGNSQLAVQLLKDRRTAATGEPGTHFKRIRQGEV